MQTQSAGTALKCGYRHFCASYGRKISKNVEISGTILTCCVNVLKYTYRIGKYIEVEVSLFCTSNMKMKK